MVTERKFKNRQINNYVFSASFIAVAAPSKARTEMERRRRLYVWEKKKSVACKQNKGMSEKGNIFSPDTEASLKLMDDKIQFYSIQEH